MSRKEILQKLVQESSSFSEMLRKQNKSISGDAVKLLKKELETYDIPYHFIEEKKFSTKKELDEILQENVTYQSSRLKNRLIKAGLKEDKCEICGQSNMWNNKPLVLQLDHIDGNHNNNLLKNLRIVCPNCHSQTDTFSNKRLKKRNYCIDCNKEIGLSSTRCQSCSAKHVAKLKQKNTNKVYPTKEELLKLILDKPFTEIGRIYNVKDNAVRKWCKKYNLPYRKKDIKDLYFNK